MSKVVHINSASHFNSLISSSAIVVVDFYADWCGPCKQIAPLYEQLSARLSRAGKITFVKVNTDEQKDVAQAYQISAMPTFMIFKNGQAVSKILGADPRKLSDAVQKLVAEAESNGSAAEGGFSDVAGKTDSKERWLGATLPKGYKDITDQVDVKGLDLLNSDSDLGTARTLFEDVKPSAITTTDAGKGKSKASGEEKSPDWVESDTDEQMMLFIPFQSTLKIHSLHITSLPPQTTEGEDASNTPMRPKTINVYSNRAHVLGFEEAEDIPATQSITLSARDWDAESGTAKVELRFVKFQNVSSFVIFVVEGDGEGDKVRLDRIRIVGETGEKRGLGKLEKIGDEQGE